MMRTTAWLAGAALIALAVPAAAQDTQDPPAPAETTAPDPMTPDTATQEAATPEPVTISVGAEVTSSDGQLLGTVSGGTADSITVEGSDGVTRELESGQITVGADGAITTSLSATDYGALSGVEEAEASTEGGTPPTNSMTAPATTPPATTTPATPPTTTTAPTPPVSTTMPETQTPPADPTTTPPSTATPGAPPVTEGAMPEDEEDDDAAADPADGEVPTPQA